MFERSLLPFDLLGIHSDSGGEFINAHLLRYCQQHQIDFTRSRAYRKNDNNFTEQKNFDVVRHVGYARYDTPATSGRTSTRYDRLRLMVTCDRAPSSRRPATAHGSGGAMIVRRLPIAGLIGRPSHRRYRIVHLQRRLLRLAAERATPLERAG